MDNTLTVRRVPLEALHQDSANVRSHPDENLEAIEGSLRRFGQAEPLVVQKSWGRVIGGNGRLAVMKRLGWTECDVVELEVDDLTATALGIALNRTAETATWNQEALAGLLKELQTQGAMEGTGFDDADLDALLAELGEEVEPAEVDDPGEQERPEKPISRAGDLWTLGDHRVLVGDSTNAADVERLMAGEKAALLSTDPPYCVNYTATTARSTTARRAARTGLTSTARSTSRTWASSWTRRSQWLALATSWTSLSPHWLFTAKETTGCMPKLKTVPL